MRSTKNDDDGISSNRRPQSPIQRLHRLDGEIGHYLSFQDSIWLSPAASTQFLRLIDSLLLTIPTLATSLDFADDLLQRSMSRLQDEFSTLLSDPVTSPPIRPHSDLDDPYLPIPVAYPIKDFNLFIDALPGGTIKDLSEIARRMAAGGFGQGCANEYSKSRREFVVESVARLGVRAFTDEDIQNMEFSELDVEIQRWNQAVKFVFLILFPSERRLSDRVFAGLMPISDLAFADSCKDTAVDLMRFAKGIALGTRSPERLFRMVDMYETTRDLLPEIEAVFGDVYCEYLVDEYELCCVKLGQAVKEIFVELENLVLRDPVNNVFPGGGVHPITRYVINYLHAAAGTWRTLEEIMEDVITPGGDQLSPSSSLSAQIGWIMERLNRNLDEKSRAYINESLSCVFLMNNGHYMVQKLAGSELTVMLGEEWVRGQVGKIRQWLAMYQKRSWSRLTTLWQVNHISGVGSLDVVKRKLNFFNTYLDETCGEQKGWVMVDEVLREEVRKAIVEFVIPTYTTFLQRARKELGKQMDNTVRYSPDDVEDRIRELFEVARRKPSFGKLS